MADELNADEAAEAKAAEDAAAAEAVEAKAAEGEKVAADAKAAAEKKAEEPHWRDFITDDGAKKEAVKFESIDAVFKSRSDLRRQLSDRILIPGKDGDEKDVEKFRKAMGIPEKADDYKFDLPEGMEMTEADQALLDAVKPMAHEANVPSSVLSAFVVGFKEMEAQIVAEHTATLEKHMEDAVDELRKEWGPKDYDANVNIANRAMEQLGGKDMVEFLNETEATTGGIIANHPVMVRMFAKLGRQMSEDGVMAPVDRDEAKTLDAEMDDLTVKANAAYAKGDRATAAKFFAERDKVSERLHGDGPIVGSEGRAA